MFFSGFYRHCEFSLFYAFVVTLMAVASFWVYHAWGRAALFVPIGGILFAFSDAVIGYYLLRPGGYFSGMAIWLMYFSAQLLIMHSPRVIMSTAASDG